MKRQIIPSRNWLFCILISLLFVNCEVPGAITLQSGQAMQPVDKEGKAISTTAIPLDLRGRIATIKIRAGNDTKEVTPGLVVAKVKLPRDEADSCFGSSLVGKTWYGGLHYLNGANPDIVCILVRREGGPCRLEIRKLNYKTISIPIPNIDPGSKLIWLGELVLERVGPTEGVRHVVSGKVLTADGEPIDHGEVWLRVNGTPPRRGSKPIKKGVFFFDGVLSGDYLVEFSLDGYSAETWRLSLKDGDGNVEKTITVVGVKPIAGSN